MKKILLLLVAIIFVAMLAFVGYFYFTKTVKSTVVPNVNYSNQPEAANWKTYRNDIYGFELNYPSNFILEEKSPNNFSFFNGDYKAPAGALGYNVRDGEQRLNFSLLDASTHDLLSVLDVLDVNEDPTIYLKKYSITIDGKIVDAYIQATVVGPQFHTAFTHDSYIFDVQGIDKDIASKILSTVKFHVLHDLKIGYEYVSDREFSRDGRHYAYYALAKNENGALEDFIVQDGKEWAHYQNPTNAYRLGRNSMLSFSPDGTKLVYAASVGETFLSAGDLEGGNGWDTIGGETFLVVNNKELKHYKNSQISWVDFNQDTNQIIYNVQTKEYKRYETGGGYVERSPVIPVVAKMNNDGTWTETVVKK